jgi:hypothetical protein
VDFEMAGPFNSSSRTDDTDGVIVRTKIRGPNLRT